MRIAMIGTRGVPARYGGFETAVEEIGKRLVKLGHEVTVYCRNPGQHEAEYLGMHLVNLPAIRTKTTETLSHTAVSSVHAVTRDHPDVAFVFNAANAPLVPMLRAARIPTAVHLDGLESLREKWRGMGARYYTWAEGASVRWADAVIADAWAIAAHVQERYGRDSVYIPYGAPIIEPGSDRLSELGLSADGYHLVVARYEPENHVLDAVQGYRASGASAPLVVVGDSPYSKWYVEAVREAAAGDPRVRLVGSVYDQELLDQLYGHCTTYVHGHSVGGTNPSLLRAMGAGAPVLAWDVDFNHEVTNEHALFWDSPSALALLLDGLEAEPDPTDLGSPGLADEVAAASRSGRRHAAKAYRWDDVADDYERLAQRLPVLHAEHREARARSRSRAGRRRTATGRA